MAAAPADAIAIAGVLLWAMTPPMRSPIPWAASNPAEAMPMPCPRTLGEMANTNSATTCTW